MGWFSKKKKVELPTLPHKDILQFPMESKSEKEILPEKIQQDVGVNQPLPPPEMPVQEQLPVPEVPQETGYVLQQPFFLRAQHYQELFNNLDSFNAQTREMDSASKKLEKSEFNENRNYESLKNSLKKVHDRLLFMDDLIFKK